MKKLFTIFIAIIVSVGFISTSLIASEGKGQRIFLKKLRKACGHNGFVMAKKHTQEEWTKIFKTGNLNRTMALYCTGAKTFKIAEERHVAEFLVAFASDSGQIPVG